MKNSGKTREQLLEELELLNNRVIELEKDKKKFEIFAEYTSDSIAITSFDLKSKYLYVSPSCKRVLGYSSDELLGRSAFSFFHPEDKKVLLILLKKYIKLIANKILNMHDPTIEETIEFRYKHKDGKWHYMQSTLNFIGKNLLSITRDITDRKQTEKILSKSEQKYRLLATNTLDTIWTTDQKFNLTFVNDAIYNFLGYKPEEFIGLNPAVFTPPEGMEVIRNAAAKLLASYKKGEISQYKFELQQIRKDGTKIDVEITSNLLLDSEGQIIGFQGRSIDITERKKAEQTIKVSESNLRSLFNVMTDIVLEIDSDGTYINIAPTSPDLLYKPAKEMLGKTLHEVFPRHEAEKFLTMIRRSLHENRVVEMEYCLEIKGECVWFECRITPKTKNSVLYIARDITERKRTKEALIENEEKFQALTNQSTEGITVADMKGNYVFVNPAFCEMSGYTKEELLTKTVFDMKAPNQKNSSFYNSKGAMEGVPIQVNLQRKDGTEYLTEIVGKVISIGDQKLVLGTIRDISERKKTEEALKESEKKYRTIFEEFQDLYYKTDLKGILLDISPSVKKLSGFEPEEVIGKPVSDIYKNPSDHFNFVREIKKHGSVEDHELILLGKGGREIISSATSHISYDNNNNPIGIEGVLRDITKRKQTENALLESEQRYSRLFQESNDAIFIHDLEGNIIDVNRKTISLFGYAKDELLSLNISQFHPSNEHKKSQEAFKTILKEESVSFEINFKKKNGEIFPGEVSSNLHVIEGEKFVQGVVHDITERKRMETRLKQNEKMLRQIIDTLPNCIFVKDRNGKYLVVNKNMAELYGTSSEKLVGKYDYEIAQKWFKTVDYNKFRKTEQDVIDNGITLFINSELFVYPDGTERWFQTTKIPFEMVDDHNCLLTISIDITERIKADEVIKSSEERLKILFESAPDAYYLIDLKGTFIDGNKAAEKLIKYTKEELIGKNFLNLKLLSAKELTKASKLLLKSIQGKGTGPDEFTLNRKNGKKVSVEIQTYPVKIKNKTVVLGIARDITERKKAEVLLRESEEQYRLLFNLLPYGGEVIDTNGRIIKCSPSTAQMLGYELSELIGKHITELLAPDSIHVFKQKFPELLSGKPMSADVCMICKDGTELNILRAAQPIMNGSNKIESVLALNIDITERNKALELLQESEEKHRKLIETTSEGFWLINEERVNIDVNQSLCDMLGYSRDEMIGKEPSDFVDKVNNEILTKQIILSKTTKHRTYEISLKRKNGTNFPTLFNATSIFDKNGKPSGSFAFVTDITEKKKAEINLSESEKKYRDLFEKSKDAILIIHNRKFVDCNQAAINMLNYQSKDEFLDIHPSKLSPEIQLDGRLSFTKANEMMDTAISNGSHRFEWLHKRSNGEIFPVEVLLTAISVEKKNQIIHTVWRDITERKLADEQIKKDLDEKRTLLMEIYHRTKNNMQIISSMLSMRSRQSQDKYISSTFREIINKIKAMSLVHDKLYKSKDLSKINFKEYVRDLLKLLMTSFQIESENIKLKYEAEDIYLLIDSAIPLGLILNELISNVFKHAFPDNKKGEISISLYKEGDTINILVSDNGIGLSPDFDLRKSNSIGFQTMFTLIEHQLKGEATYKVENGLKWHIKVKSDLHRRRV